MIKTLKLNLFVRSFLDVLFIVRLREVKNVVFERRNRRDRGLVSANGKCQLTRGVRQWRFDCRRIFFKTNVEI